MSGLMGHVGLLLGGAWSPSQLAVAPKVWADDQSTTAVSSGVASSWGNRGSIGGAFEQSSSSMRPQILDGSLNGRRVLRFDGVDDYLRMATSSSASIFQNTGVGWSFSVARKRNVDTSATRILVYAPAAGGATRFQVGLGSTSPNQNRNFIAVRRLDADATSIVFGGVAGTDWIIRRTEMNWATNSLTDYINGTLDISASPAASSGSTSNTAAYLNALDIGANGTPGVPSGCADVDLACLFMGSGSSLSTADWRRMEGWAAWRYGLQANLPISHPYKNSPP